MKRMKKMITLINNERTDRKITAPKACDATSVDVCLVDDRAGCQIYAYDYCNKDYAACSNRADDVCGYDFYSCSGIGEDDIPNH